MLKRLYRLLPGWVREPLRRGYRRFTSLRHRARERLRPVRVSQTEIERALRELGVGEGGVVFFQAGMAAFGTIEGGPEAVIDALEAVVGEQGLIAMPADVRHIAIVLSSTASVRAAVSSIRMPE